MLSCKYLLKLAPCTMLFSFSRTRSLACRMWRRISASAGLAWSLISSSLMMASVMAVSSWRKVCKWLARPVTRGVFSRSVTSALRAARAAVRLRAMSSSARGDRLAPFSAIERLGRTSLNSTSGLPPR